MQPNPLAHLDLKAKYTVRDVLLSCALDGDAAEMMIMRFFAKKVGSNPTRMMRQLLDTPHLRLTRGTGAEFQYAYDTGTAVIALCKELKLYQFRPGRPPRSLAEPLPPTFVPLFIRDYQSN